MNITPVQMLHSGTATFFVGFAFGIMAEVFSFLSTKIKTLTTKLNFIEIIKDTLIVLSFTICSILVLYYNCNGRLRAIFILILILGYLSNKLLLSRIISNILEFLYTIFIKILKILYAFFIQPIEKSVKKLYNKIKKIKHFNRSKQNNERTKGQTKIE